MRRRIDDILAKARSLSDQDRSAEARDLLCQAIKEGLDSAQIRNLMGFVLHQLGDFRGCERELRQAVQMAPQDGAAEFALAAINYRLGEEAEAEAAARRAITKGMDDIHSYLLLGRIFNKQGRFEEARAAYQTAVRRDPSSLQAQRELAQLVWMMTGNLAAARAQLDVAPQTPEIVAITVRLLQDAGEEEAAFVLAAERARVDPSLNILAARAGLKFNPMAAEHLLSSAPPAMMPGARAKAEIELDLALGRIDRAVRRSEALHNSKPGDQHAKALLAVAWRLAADPRYKSLFDYDRLVKIYRIDVPVGWDSLEQYLGELSGTLEKIHGCVTHPIGQSLRHGSQTTRSLADYSHPAIRALFRAIDLPLRRHLAAIGEPDQGYAIASSWSVRLNSGGFHINHIHPEGWISSAFYCHIPKALAGNEGMLKFGEPGPPTFPALRADHVVKPEPGMLVLFPSYMWHGTEPFFSDEERLSCAFDIVRKP